MKIDCTIMILTWKGLHHLEHLLPTVKETIENTKDYKVDVLIVENGFHEPSKKYVNENFPEFRFEYSPVNDYLFSLNAYAEKLDSEFIYVMNDDMRMHPDSMTECLKIAKANPNLFAVSSNVLDWEGKEMTNFIRELHYTRGWLRSAWNPQKTDDKVRYSLYGAGGAAAFRTKMYNELGGFSPLYRPAYCEDLDLGHRAWHRGWEIVFCPTSTIYHREGATIPGQYGSDGMAQRIYRNQILWMVRNCNYPNFLFWFFLLLPYRLLLGWRVDKNTNIALWKSLGRMGKALSLRRKEPKAKISDIEIVKKISDSIYEFR